MWLESIPHVNLVLDFDLQPLYNEASRQRKAYRMRPVDQIVAELKKANAATKLAMATEDKLFQELQDVQKAALEAIQNYDK